MDAAAAARRKLRLGALSGGGVLFLAAALASANFLSRSLSFRLDLSADGRYSLSDASRRLVRDLPGPVTVRAYVSQGLPPPYEGQARYMKDLLKEYKAAGRGKVSLELKDPESSEKVKDEARALGVTAARFTQVASDQFQIREGFMGLALSYQDKQEVLPFLKNPDGLEYDVSARLKKMTSPGRKLVGVVVGHNERDLASLRAGPAARLLETFDAKPVRLSTGPGGASPDLFLLSGPAGKLSSEEIAYLDRAVGAGVPIAIFLSRKGVSLHNFVASPRSPGLEDWLAHYGVRVGEDIVMDPRCQQISFRSPAKDPSGAGDVPFVNLINYPPFILSRPERRSPLKSRQDALAFPFAHPLTLSTAGAGGLSLTPLARSTPDSWLPAELFSLDPKSLRPPAPADPRGPFVLAATVEGSTTSFADPGRPVRVRFAVVGTDYFLDDKLPVPPGNADFAAALAEWLVQDKAFLSIPSRGPLNRPVRMVSPPVREAVKAAGYFLLPGLMVLWGAARRQRRRALGPRIRKEWEQALRS